MADGGVCNAEAAVLSRTPVILRQPERESAILSALAANTSRKPLAVLAPSGAGKSTFLASLVSKLRNQAVVVVAVFIGATENSTSISRVLAAVCDCLEPDGDASTTGDFVELTRRFHGILERRSTSGARTTLVFDALNELESSHQARALGWLPAELPSNTQVLLSAIDAPPANAPAGDPSALAVKQVLAALRTRFELHAGGPGVEVLGSLSRDEREALLRAHLEQRDLRGKFKSVGDEVLGAAFAKADAQSPLYIQLVAEEICAAAEEEELVALLEAFPGQLGGAFEYRLAQLEGGDGDTTAASAKLAARATLACALTGQGCLYEHQLQSIWLDALREAAAGTSATAAGTGLKAARAAAALKPKGPKAAATKSAGEKVKSSQGGKGKEAPKAKQVGKEAEREAGSSASAEQPDAHPGASASGDASDEAEVTRTKLAQEWRASPMSAILRLPAVGASGAGDGSAAPIGFVHMQARDAVQRRYIGTSMEAARRSHARLVALFRRAADPTADGSWQGRSKLPAPEWLQALRRLPLHACGAVDAEAVQLCLCSLGFVRACCDAGLAFELLQCYALAIGDAAIRAAMPAAGLDALTEFREFVKENASSVLAHAPWLLMQQAANAAEDAAVIAREVARSRHEGAWIEWLNKPRHKPACVATFAQMGSLVWAAAWAPDGTRFVLGGSDRMIHVIDAATGEELETLSGHTDDLTHLSYSPADGASMVSAADGDPLLVWACPRDARGSLERKLTMLDASAVGLDWSADGSLLGVASRDGVLRVINAGGEWAVRATWTLDPKAEGKLCGVSWCSASRQLAAGLGDSVLIVACGAEHADAATAGEENADAAAATLPMRRLAGHQAQVTCVCWSPGAKAHTLASADADGSARVWDAEAGTPLHTWPAHEEYVHSLHLAGGGRLLSASADNVLRVWDVSGIGNGDATPEVRSIGVLRAHSADARIGRLSPHGATHALSGGDDGTARLWDLRRVEGHTEEAPGSVDAIQACAWCVRRDAAGGALVPAIVTGDCKGLVQCFDGGIGRAEHWRRQLDPLAENCVAIASVAAAGEVAACAAWRCVHLLSTADGASLTRLDPPMEWRPDWFNSCALASIAADDEPGGALRLCASGDNALIAVWCHRSGAWGAAERCRGLQGDVLSVELSRHGDRFCSSSNEGEVLLWEATNLTAPLRRFAFGAASAAVASTVRHAGWVHPPDGEPLLVAVLGGVGGLVMWRVSDGDAPIAEKMSASTSGAADRSGALAWCGGAHGGTRLVTTGADKRVRVWSVPELRETASLLAAGAFGSADGIGGEGSFSSDGTFAVGDGSGRLLVLRLRD